MLCLATLAAGALVTPTIRTSSDFKLTEPLRTYADSKLSKWTERYENEIQSVTLSLKVERLHVHDQEHRGAETHVAEVTARCKDKRIIRVEHTEKDMYKTLDMLSDRLGRALRKYKERSAQGGRRAVAETPVEEEEEEEVPAAQEVSVETPDVSDVALSTMPWTVVRKKSFPMPAISIDEAVLCLEYIDHSFYVFRNVETDQVNVVYKRNSGGVGLIEPEQ